MDVDGFQHPGDGTGTPPPPDLNTRKRNADDITSPVVEPGDPHGDTDFVIKPTLRADNIDGWL